MSFGYSVGDFLKVVELAYLIYERCQNATSEFRDLGRDVGNAHIVLRTVYHFWESEEKRGGELLRHQVDQLKELAENCEEVLVDIEKIRARHSDLGTRGSFVARAKSRSKYVVNDLIHNFGAVRGKLQRYTSNLARFHTMLTTEVLHGATEENRHALTSLKEQADIVNAIVKTYQDFQEGKRAEPAYSQRSRAANAEDQTLIAIIAAEKELQEEGINKEAFQNHRDLIKEWLEIVILSADSEDDQDDDNEPAPAPAIAPVQTDKTPEGTQVPDGNRKKYLSYMERTLPGPDAATSSSLNQGAATSSSANQGAVTPSSLDQAAATPSSPLSYPTHTPTTVKRSSSVDTHRSQESTWKSQEASEMGDYPIRMISKVLRSKYPPSVGEEHFKLPLKRAFYGLDHTDRRWLTRKDVQLNLSAAATRLGIPINDRTLIAMIRTEDEKEGTSDYRIDVTEFINITLRLRQHFCSLIERRARIRGLELAMAEARSWQECLENKAISSFWKKRSEKKRWTLDEWYEHALGGRLANGAFPLSQNLTNALHLGTNYCLDEIDNASRQWRKESGDQISNDEQQVFEPLNMALEAATLYYRYVPEEDNVGLHWLDDLIEAAELLPFQNYEGLQGCPLRLAVEFRSRLWNVLSIILGIVSDVKDCTKDKKDALYQWRKRQLSERTQALHNLAQETIGSETAKDFETIRCWIQKPDGALKLLRDRMNESLQTTKILRQVQEQNSLPPILPSVPSTTKFKILSRFALDEVPKSFFRKAFFLRPTTQCCLSIDGQKQGTETSEKDTSPRFTFLFKAYRDSIVKCEFCILQKDDYQLIGSVEFKVKERVDLARKANVSYSAKLEHARKGFSSVVVTLDLQLLEEEEEEEDHIAQLEAASADSTMSDASYILSQPLPDGWEVQRHSVPGVKEDGVFFCHMKTSEKTAILWYDRWHREAPSMTLTPLPPGWSKLVRNGKVQFKDGSGKLSDIAPEVGDKATFQNVLSVIPFAEQANGFEDD